MGIFEPNVNNIDYSEWKPVEYAVLCFIFDKSHKKVLLIHKKRGLGQGKVNAPGGRIEKNEKSMDAAVRECQEEVGLTPFGLIEVGQLFFSFSDGYSLHATVFFANDFSGKLIETDEADPFWCEILKIPYDNMWADDVFWLPKILSGIYVKGYFTFDNDKMLSYKLEETITHEF